MPDDAAREALDIYSLAVVLARAFMKSSPLPAPGDLVVEVTKFTIDPDAIGWLVEHGDAAFLEDNTGPKREVWDIVPLRGLSGECKAKGFQRWENAEFMVIPDGLVKRALTAKHFAPATAGCLLDADNLKRLEPTKP